MSIPTKCRRITFIVEGNKEFKTTINNASRFINKIGRYDIISVTEKEVNGSLHITVWYWAE